MQLLKFLQVKGIFLFFLFFLWYNNLTALAKSKILTPEKTLYHKLRISKEIRPAAATAAAAQGARNYGIMNPSIMIAATSEGGRREGGFAESPWRV